MFIGSFFVSGGKAFLSLQISTFLQIWRNPPTPMQHILTCLAEGLILMPYYSGITYILFPSVTSRHAAPSILTAGETPVV